MAVCVLQYQYGQREVEKNLASAGIQISAVQLIGSRYTELSRLPKFKNK